MSDPDSFSGDFNIEIDVSERCTSPGRLLRAYSGLEMVPSYSIADVDSVLCPYDSSRRMTFATNGRSGAIVLDFHSAR